MSNIIKKPAQLPAEATSHELVPHDAGLPAVNMDERYYARAGWLIVLAGVCAFLIWAFTAPLDRGVPMSGHVTKQSNRQAVQHQLGGTVRQLLVRNGAKVKAGQVLVRLDQVTAKSQLDVSLAQYQTARATEARLIAERDGAAAISFPAELLEQKNDPHVAGALDLQQQLFLSRRSALQAELGAMNENLSGLEAQIGGTRESLASKKEQQALLKEQLSGMRDLAKEGYVARNRLLDLERTYSQINGQISEDIGNIGRSQRQVAELKLKRSQRQQEFQKEVRNSLSDVQREAASLAARMEAQRYELANVEVKAPVSGTVVDMAVSTVGAVVAPGFKMMDIVPADDPLVVEGQLPVHLIDKVHPGLPVELIFSAFNTHTTPQLPGEVVTVAADRTVDERSGMAYYVVRVKVTEAGLRTIAHRKLEVQSGMPVELFVKTGERTMMNYLLKPVMDRAHSALSEE